LKYRSEGRTASAVIREEAFWCILLIYEEKTMYFSDVLKRKSWKYVNLQKQKTLNKRKYRENILLAAIGIKIIREEKRRSALA